MAHPGSASPARTKSAFESAAFGLDPLSNQLCFAAQGWLATNVFDSQWEVLTNGYVPKKEYNQVDSKEMFGVRHNAVVEVSGR